jgi:hypothetical protein
MSSCKSLQRKGAGVIELLFSIHMLGHPLVAVPPASKRLEPLLFAVRTTHLPVMINSSIYQADAQPARGTVSSFRKTSKALRIAIRQYVSA